MKKLLKLICLMLMVTVLTGCIKMNVNVEVKADKTMTMGMELLIEESLLSTSGMTAEEWGEQMKEQILSSDNAEDTKTTPISKTIDGVKWAGINVEYTGEDSESTSYITEKNIDGEDCLVLTLPMDDFNDQMDTSDLEAYGYSVSKLKDMGTEMSITIKMPAKVTSNVGEVNGDTVTIDLLDLMTSGATEDIVISSPLSSGSSMTYVLIGVGAIAIVAIVLVILKKKKQPVQEEMAYTGQPLSQPEVQADHTMTEEVTQETVEAAKTVEDSNKQFCPNCGTPVDTDDTCSNCGYDLKK